MGQKFVLNIEQKRECQVQINVGDEVNIEQYEVANFVAERIDEIISFCVDDSDWLESPASVDRLSIMEVEADTNNPIYEFDGDWLDEV